MQIPADRRSNAANQNSYAKAANKRGVIRPVGWYQAGRRRWNLPDL